MKCKPYQLQYFAIEEMLWHQFGFCRIMMFMLAQVFCVHSSQRTEFLVISSESQSKVDEMDIIPTALMPGYMSYQKTVRM